MPPTGKRLSTSGGIAAALLAAILAPAPAAALDIFTLWRQPEIPLDLEAGSWVDYRSQVMAGGRREEGLARIVCLPAPPDAEAGAVAFEILPLAETDAGRLVPVPGEGTWLLVSGAIAERRGRLLDAVIVAWRWRDGDATAMTREQLRDDPLVEASLQSDFLADTVTSQEPTTRVIGDSQFLCDQLVLSAADTQSVVLPAGRMVQVTSREVAVAVHAELPLLGLAYASERIRAESTLDPPSSRMRPPPPRVRVEVMELVGYGRGAAAVLGPGN